ncbi:hypothetical protein [Homoserinibacter sp. GY 40078]|uniref:hypothetical protein n=1 Tax=Homoserinibacter sp. GY 40078 TaxID=2603275 RepID=UPI00164FFA5D|nr:hypothetical protein [Homoserinibacter sp. GY 40078]
MLNRVLPLVTSTLVVAVSSILLVPALVTAIGPHAWSSVAVAQAVGGLGAAVLLFGWGVTGPALVARADTAARHQRNLESIRVRSALTPPVVVATSLCCIALTPEHMGLAVLGCLTTLVTGLSAAWYFLGTGQSWLVLLFEGLPRSAGNLAAIGLALSTNDGQLALGASVAGALLGAVGGTLYVHTSTRRHREVRARRSLVSLLREGFNGVSASIVNSVYGAAPLMIYAALPTSGLTVFTLVDKLVKQALSGFGPIANALQGWVPAAQESDLWRRIRIAAAVGAAAFIGATVTLASTGTWVLGWLSGGTITVDWTAGAAAGLLIGLSSMELVLARSCLIALGATRAMSVATLWTSIAGLTLMAGAAVSIGPVAATLGLAIGVAARVLVYVVVILRHRRAPAAEIAMNHISGAST